MVYNIITLPVTIMFVICGGCLFFYAIKLKRLFPEEHNFNNSLLTLILWILAGILYPLFFWTDIGRIRWFLSLSTFFICILTPSVIILILFYQYLFVIKKNPDKKTKRSIENFLLKFDNGEDRINDKRSYNLKTDIHRKALHLFPAGIIIILWVFAVYIWEGVWKANDIWGISGMYLGRFLILTAGYCGILVFGSLDLVRLSFIFKKRNLYHLIPDNVQNLLGKTMKRRENFDFIRPAVLILAFIPVFFFPFGIFATGVLIATIGDGAASVFGLRFGKTRVPKNSNKTIVGYIAGSLASFLIGIIILSIFGPNLHRVKTLMMALSGAIMFFIIDFSNLNIDDNILDPILCSAIMGIIYYIL